MTKTTDIIAIVIATEVFFMIATRLVLRHYPWDSMEAELIRTTLRLGTAYIYWRLCRTYIYSRVPDSQTLHSAVFGCSLLLLLSVPALSVNLNLPTNMAILFSVTSLAVAIKEEFLFRGIIQNLLETRFSPTKSIVLANLLFAAFHIGVVASEYWVFSAIFLIGLMLSLIYARSGSIVVVIVIHAAYDAIASFTPLVPQPLNRWYGLTMLVVSLIFVYRWSRPSLSLQGQMAVRRAIKLATMPSPKTMRK